jgi:exodeoxyribonuclease (lambda-induced)
MEQRTHEWHQVRGGKFTASNIHRLMGIKGLGKTGETYIMEKVVESLGVEIPSVQTYVMQYGIEMEPYAKAYYESAMGCKIQDVAFQIATWNKDAGCSPDGLIIGQNKGLEIKCPYNPVHHVENLLIKSQEDLKQLRTEYYWQIQMSMAVFDLPEWDFVSYHPEFSGTNRMMAVTIKANPSDIELMKLRISEAVKIKNDILKRIRL